MKTNRAATVETIELANVSGGIQVTFTPDEVQSALANPKDPSNAQLLGIIQLGIDKSNRSKF